MIRNIVNHPEEIQNRILANTSMNVVAVIQVSVYYSVWKHVDDKSLFPILNDMRQKL